MEKKIEDKVLGTITVRTHPRAKHYTLRISNGSIYATMPPGGNEKRMFTFIEEKREALQNIIQVKQLKRLFWDETSSNQYTTFRLHIFRTERDNFYMKLDKEVLHIACPEHTDFRDNRVQEIIQNIIDKALRHEAKRLLPERIDWLAKQHSFIYRQVKINKSKSRWGSCNVKKDINLSLSLMTLPWHLIDYVLLHELCHTVVLNHSDRFWQLMDKVTNSQAKALRKELKSQTI
ncbi:MAG: M48 family metallopeptidase [Tannerellaceae bacterium]|nr:M48 family metallopeptidase [Tannerellaceae bacterium]